MTTYKIVSDPEDVSLDYTAAGRDISTTTGYVVPADAPEPTDYSDLEDWARAHGAVLDEDGDPVTVALSVHEDPNAWEPSDDEELRTVGLRRVGPWTPWGDLVALSAVGDTGASQ